MTHTDKTRVVFLICTWRATDESEWETDVLAVFPDHLGANSPNTMMAYDHVGQHFYVTEDYLKWKKLAKPEEYADLASELTNLFDYDLDIAQNNNERQTFMRTGYSRRIRQLRRVLEAARSHV